jgi:DNA/RNA endonuclease YhcR with UshA esterase domain
MFAGITAARSKMANDERIDTLQGKIIGVTGTVELYQGKPEIRVMSPDQIKILSPAWKAVDDAVSV